MLLVWITKRRQYILQMHIQTDVDLSTTTAESNPFAKLGLDLSQLNRVRLCSCDKDLGKLHSLVLKYFISISLEYKLDARVIDEEGNAILVDLRRLSRLVHNLFNAFER